VDLEGHAAYQGEAWLAHMALEAFDLEELRGLEEVRID
jgi:hypothetical protein